MSDCVFCAIAVGQIPADIVAASETAVAFRDRNPAAAVHVLVIPRSHYKSAAQMASVDALGMAELFALVGEVVSADGIDASGYRVLTNVGADAGQEVEHLHLHVVGGERLGPLLHARERG